MAEKARIFGDDYIRSRILQEKTVRADMVDFHPVYKTKYLKSLGRKVANFNEATWQNEREAIMEKIAYHKFTATPEARALLLGTGSRSIVEASPYDGIWGIKYAEANALKHRSKWGLNIAGRGIQAAREKIKFEENQPDSK
jgi:hypothetical protein